jgi:hypothetical protein
MNRSGSAVHIVVFRHYEKSDPDAVYYGSMHEAVGAVEPGTRLFAVWGGIFNPENKRFEPEDLAEDFLAAWTARRRALLAERYWSDEAHCVYGGRATDLERYLEDALEPPEILLTAAEPRHSALAVIPLQRRSA